MCSDGKLAAVETLGIGLGGNTQGRWGPPRATLARAVHELQRAGLTVLRASSLYATQPLSDVPQPRYLNQVVMARASIGPGMLLRLLKRIERRAGRRTARAMAARPLDMDILDFGGRRIGRPARRREQGRLILPHPEMHRRAFVLVPLLEVAPAWRHPRLGRSAKTLLAQLAPSSRRSVRQALDSATNTCDKTAK
jgi:2-amino-4-hydroxy-6-hydroxymethyldihydropteridine diphosphokinase